MGVQDKAAAEFCLCQCVEKDSWALRMQKLSRSVLKELKDG